MQLLRAEIRTASPSSRPATVENNPGCAPSRSVAGLLSGRCKPPETTSRSLAHAKESNHEQNHLARWRRRHRFVYLGLLRHALTLPGMGGGRAFHSETHDAVSLRPSGPYRRAARSPCMSGTVCRETGSKRSARPRRSGASASLTMGSTESDLAGEAAPRSFSNHRMWRPADGEEASERTPPDPPPQVRPPEADKEARKPPFISLGAHG